MTQKSNLPHSPTLPSLYHHHYSSASDSDPSSSSSSSLLFSYLFAFPSVSNSLVVRIFRQFCCAQLLRIHFRFFILLSLPIFYFLISTSRRSSIKNILVVLPFSIALLLSLNLTLSRLPSFRLFVARSLPINILRSSSSSKPPQPLIWSIGTKPKLERKQNSGFWVQVYSNGDVYEGEIHKGKSSGSGVYHYHMSGRYEGDWIDQKYDGYGVETWAKGSRYRGQYREGLRHGIGVYRFFTGDVYAGAWSNGQCHGCGVHTCEDGSKYIGEFKWGLKHGFGHYYFRIGDKYAGEYFADKMHGFGVYHFENGHRYEGAWHEGRRQGLGMYTFRNRDTKFGHWQNGLLDVPSVQNTHPGSLFSVNYTKILNVIQEARRAAEKAHALCRVDETVNRAIAVANKAANAARVAAIKAVQNQIRRIDPVEDKTEILRYEQ